MEEVEAEVDMDGKKSSEWEYNYPIQIQYILNNYKTIIFLYVYL